MKITILAENGPVVYEDASFIEIETNEPVQFEAVADHDVQIYRLGE